MTTSCGTSLGVAFLMAIGGRRLRYRSSADTTNIPGGRSVTKIKADDHALRLAQGRATQVMARLRFVARSRQSPFGGFFFFFFALARAMAQAVATARQWAIVTWISPMLNCSTTSRAAPRKATA